ncbi:MAG: NAD-dependent epimerase/dehydratase family protein [Micromonosporaceae bacterium]
MTVGSTPMRVLVTGGAGFIGSHLTDALLARGDQVTVLDDLSTGRAARLGPRAALHQISVTDPAAVTALTTRTQPEVIFHLAAQIDVRASVADPAADAAVNIGGTINMLDAARAAGARVVFASTGGALYGMNAPVPSPEDLVPEPEAPYGTAKYCAECYIGLYNRLHGTRHAVLRLGNVYGPRQDPAGEAGVVSIFCGRIARGQQPLVYGDGRQTRDYVYVGDVVDAFLAAADTARPGTWNIGTGCETSVLDLVRLIGQAAGHEPHPQYAPPRPGELRRSGLDVTRASHDLGWKATTPLPEGIAAVYHWVQVGEPDRAER